MNTTPSRLAVYSVAPSPEISGTIKRSPARSFYRFPTSSKAERCPSRGLVEFGYGARRRVGPSASVHTMRIIGITPSTSWCAAGRRATSEADASRLGCRCPSLAIAPPIRMRCCFCTACGRLRIYRPDACCGRNTTAWLRSRPMPASAQKQAPEVDLVELPSVVLLGPEVIAGDRAGGTGQPLRVTHRHGTA